MLSPSTATEAAATIIALTAFGVKAIETEYREHSEKVLSKQMADIQDIYLQSLKDMQVVGPGENAIISTPPIFIMDEKDPNKPIKSLVLNELILKDLTDTYPAVNPDLLAYGERIHNAMQALRQFYYLRTEKRNSLHKGTQTDLTSSVLSYLILMISTHCYRFEGIETTKVYLQGFQKFVQRYGSLGGKKKKSDRYQHLSVVYDELSRAESLLFQYSLTLSYTSYLNLLIPQATSYVNELMRCAVKIITPTEHWGMVEFMSADNIANGIIKAKFDYAHEGITGGGNAIPIKESPMKEKLKTAAKNYFTAIRINDDPENKGAFVADDNFSDFFTREQYEQIYDVARDCDNFLTLKIKPHHRQNLREWLAVNKAFIDTRIKTYQDIMGLINKIIVLMYYCGNLSNRVKQLGEIYITNPHHCVYIFEIFNEFGKIIDEQIKLVIKHMLEIKNENGQIMPVSPSQMVYERLNKVVGDIRNNVTPLIKLIYIKHSEHPRNINVDFSKAIKENVSQMVTIAKKVADQYSIKTERSDQVRHANTPVSKNSPAFGNDEKEEKKLPTPGTIGRSISLPALNIPVNPASVIPAPVTLDAKPTAPADDFNEAALNKIGNLIHDIRLIDTMQAYEYTSIYQAISDLRQKAVSLTLEDSLKRQKKGKNIETMIAKLCASFEKYLALEHNTRIYQATTFNKTVKNIIGHTSAEFLDVHKSSLTFFSTHSRDLANKVIRKTDHLVKVSERQLP